MEEVIQQEEAPPTQEMDVTDADEIAYYRRETIALENEVRRLVSENMNLTYTVRSLRRENEIIHEELAFVRKQKAPAQPGEPATTMSTPLYQFFKECYTGHAPSVVLKTLAERNILRVEDLVKLSDKDLRHTKRIGSATVYNIVKALARRGLSLRDEIMERS